MATNKSTNTSNPIHLWDPIPLIAESIDYSVSERQIATIVKLTQDGNTVPFILRYRSHLTGEMSEAPVRQILKEFENLQILQKKSLHLINEIPHLERELRSVHTLEEFEDLKSQFKIQKKPLRLKVNRAKEAGLDALLSTLRDTNRKRPINWERWIDASIPQCSSVSEIIMGVQYIIADEVASNQSLLAKIKNYFDDATLITKLSNNNNNINNSKSENDTIQKYSEFFDYRISVSHIAPHRILAINRAEKAKFIKVKIQPNPTLVEKALGEIENEIIREICQPCDINCNELNKLTYDSVSDAWNRLIQPKYEKQIRRNLTKKAEAASLSYFEENLRSMLLTPPILNSTILGCDPGYVHGCKLAVIDRNGAVLCTDIVYIHIQKLLKDAEIKLSNLILEYTVNLIGIGNGHGCREAEQLVSNLIANKNRLNEFKQLKYCLVTEVGSSVYSVSQLAEQELPGMLPNFRSAVSIARRLLDPLSELVKVDPQHLGIGMYQHDINKQDLSTALKYVLESCVNKVGANINTCSLNVLKYISGISEARASSIIKFRTEKGAFINREQILDVPGIGHKTWEQCVGFLKITPPAKETLEIEEKGYLASFLKRTSKQIGRSSKRIKCEYQNNPLDNTCIHPESYSIAYKILEYISCTADIIGTPEITNKIEILINQHSLSEFEKLFKCETSTIQLIIANLKNPFFDCRQNYPQPFFKKETTSISGLNVGMSLRGQVSNVTSFGAFCDIGVQVQGLLHISETKHLPTPVKFGDVINLEIQKIDLQRERISLKLQSDNASYNDKTYSNSSTANTSTGTKDAKMPHQVPDSWLCNLF